MGGGCFPIDLYKRLHYCTSHEITLLQWYGFPLRIYSIFNVIYFLSFIKMYGWIKSYSTFVFMDKHMEYYIKESN